VRRSAPSIPWTRLSPRCHALVCGDGQQYVLHDLGSKNGTFLNGRRLTEPQPLRHSDVIALPGLTLAFRSAEETVILPLEAPTAVLALADLVDAQLR